MRKPRPIAVDCAPQSCIHSRLPGADAAPAGRGCAVAAPWRRLTGPVSNEGSAARYARRPEVVAGCERGHHDRYRMRSACCAAPARRCMAGHAFFDVSTTSRPGSRRAKRSQSESDVRMCREDYRRRSGRMRAVMHAACRRGSVTNAQRPLRVTPQRTRQIFPGACRHRLFVFTTVSAAVADFRDRTGPAWTGSCRGVSWATGNTRRQGSRTRHTCHAGCAAAH